MITNVKEADGATVVALSGRLDAVTAPEIKAKLQELIATGSVRIVLNLRKLTFIDSSGLGALVSCLRRCVAGGGDLSAAEVPQFAQSIFELTRLTRVFRIFESEQQAIAGMSRGE